MKTIYHRVNNSTYERGIFIPMSIFVNFLIGLGLLTFHLLMIFDISLSNWVLFPILLFVAITSLYLIGVQSKKENQIDIESSYNGLNHITYLFNKIKKTKSSKKKVEYNNQIEIIGQAEYYLIIKNTDMLLKFYNKCLVELNEINDETIEQIDSIKFKSLNLEMKIMIDNLEKINKLKLKK